MLVRVHGSVKRGIHDFLTGWLFEMTARRAHEHLARRQAKHVATHISLCLHLFSLLEADLAERHGRQERVIVELGPQHILLDSSRDDLLILAKFEAVLLDLIPGRHVEIKEVGLLSQQISIRFPSLAS